MRIVTSMPRYLVFAGAALIASTSRRMHRASFSPTVPSLASIVSAPSRDRGTTESGSLGAQWSS